MSRFTAKLDWGMLGAIFVLIIAGLLVLASSDTELFFKQLIWLVAALLLMLGLPLVNLKALFSYRWFILGIYFFILLLLIITYFVAPTIHGARSWITFGSFQIQPSEFMKAALIILLSSFFATRHVAIARMKIIISSFLYFLVPATLVLLQPDLGSSLVLLGIWLGYLLISGIPKKYVLIGILILAVVGALSWSFLFADYQKARIIALFEPSEDPLGVNYSVAQSKIAIGSGGLFGMGETWEDRIDMAFAIRELDVESVPINFLIPIAGSALDGRSLLHPFEALKIVSLYRFILPQKEIRICGGRLQILREFNPLVFAAGADGMITGNYLTTPGGRPGDDLKLIELFGLEVL